MGVSYSGLVTSATGFARTDMIYVFAPSLYTPLVGRAKTRHNRARSGNFDND